MQDKNVSLGYLLIWVSRPRCGISLCGHPACPSKLPPYASAWGLFPPTIIKKEKNTTTKQNKHKLEEAVTGHLLWLTPSAQK